MFGSDFLSYHYDKDKGTSVDEDIRNSLMEYSHEQWESTYLGTSSTFIDPLATPLTFLHHAPRKLPFPNSSTATATKLARNGKSSTGLGLELPTENHSLEDVILVQDGETPIQVDTCGNSKDRAKSSALSSAMLEATTRAEQAAVASLVPPVSSVFEVQVTFGNGIYTDPFSLAKRPCTDAIETAEKFLRDERNRGNSPSGVAIHGMGHFSEQGLSIVKKISDLSDIRSKVASEARWFSLTDCNSEELTNLQSTLWNEPTSKIVLKCRDGKAIDIISFSDLCGERYIDSFVLDVCISKYVEEACKKGSNLSLHFPSELFCWMESTDKRFKLEQIAARANSQMARIDNMQQILVPVFMSAIKHWGLVYVDLTNQQLYFDDGLKQTVSPAVLSSVKEALNSLLELFPHHLSLQTRFWQSTRSFSRFGMPSQAPVDAKMIGVGSCGVGVIMAARDFIQNGPISVNNIQWRFCDMDKHRKNLMLQILRWASL